MTTRNPKQDGSDLFDCVPQIGPCPMNCAECFYNRPGAFYVPIDKPSIPLPEEVRNGIVRMNCGHDSNVQRDLVIKTAQMYKHFFFNTSIPRLDFPGPVVLTANPHEEESFIIPGQCLVSKDYGFDNLMFVRLRVSSTNLHLVHDASRAWTEIEVPIVLTFMAYYSHRPSKPELYEWKKRHINSYYCPTQNFIRGTWASVQSSSLKPRLVTICGTLKSNYCKDCHNCDSYYWQTVKRIER